MMPLHHTRDPDDEAFKDILRGVAGVTRIDELHPTMDDDYNWVFIVWCPIESGDALRSNADAVGAELTELAMGLFAWSEDADSAPCEPLDAELDDAETDEAVKLMDAFRKLDPVDREELLRKLREI